VKSNSKLSRKQVRLAKKPEKKLKILKKVPQNPGRRLNKKQVN